jgi:hypothetical protein
MRYKKGEGGELIRIKCDIFLQTGDKTCNTGHCHTLLQTFTVRKNHRIHTAWESIFMVSRLPHGIALWREVKLVRFVHGTTKSTTRITCNGIFCKSPPVRQIATDLYQAKNLLYFLWLRSSKLKA